MREPLLAYLRGERPRGDGLDVPRRGRGAGAGGVPAVMTKKNSGELLYTVVDFRPTGEKSTTIKRNVLAAAGYTSLLVSTASLI